MKKIHSAARAAAAVVAALLISAAIMPISAFAEVNTPSGDMTVPFTCPAVCADEGDTIKLSDISVQFESGKTTAADKISWSSADIEIKDGKVTPKAGIYLLTAAADGKKRTVCLTVRAPGETEYLLYRNDFSSSVPDGMRTIEETAGGKVIFDSDGVLVLDASASQNAYARVLLPEYLDSFGNIKITAKMKIDSAVNTKRWASIMLRLQTGKNYPYMQVCLRSSASLANGTEIAERTTANKWNVVQKGPASIKSSEYNTVTADASGSEIVYLINGEKQLTYSSVVYDTGACGFQANGCRLTVDEVTVTVNPVNATKTKTGNFADVRNTRTNIVLAPAIITEITSAAMLKGITESSPAVAIMNVSSALDVTADGKSISALADALACLDGKVIPAFRPADTAAAAALAGYLQKNDLRDAFVISDNADIINAARNVWYHLRGVMDFSAVSPAPAELDSMRGKANKAGCRVMLLSPAAVRDNVEHLQGQFMTVWVAAASDLDADLVSAVATGANGVISGDRARLEACMSEYFAENTLIRAPGVIGHRGVPTLAPENTIPGALKAYELGATMIENDIHLSRDGVIMVMHNSTIDATTNGKGSVASMTREQLSKYQVTKNGESAPIPTLEDYFVTFGDKDVTLVVELKSSDPKLIPALVKLIKQYNYESKMVVISFHTEQIKLFHEQMPEVSAGFLTSETQYSSANLENSLIGILDSVQRYGTTFNPTYNKGTLDPELIRALSYRGVTVWPWTVNDRLHFFKYFFAGTYGITTNYSQYVTKIVRKIDTDKREYDLSSGETPTVSAESYGRTTSDITKKAAMRVISTTGDLEVTLDSSTGRITYTGSGSANVIFTYSATAENTKYAKASEVVRLVANAAETTGAPATDAPDATTAASTPVKKGCGSSAAFAAVIAAIAGLCVFGSRVTFKQILNRIPRW